jgi:hypothetical protein
MFRYVTVVFNAEIYDPAGVRRFIGRLFELLDAVARHPDVAMGDLVALGPAQ